MDEVPSIQQHEPLQTDFDAVEGHPTVHIAPEHLKLHVAAKPKIIPSVHSDDHVIHEDHEVKEVTVVEPKIIDHEAVESTTVHHLVPIVPKLEEHHPVVASKLGETLHHPVDYEHHEMHHY